MKSSMFFTQSSPALTWVSRIGRDRRVWVLLGIVALGAYLRLWQAQHLFNSIHDYDEGVYSLGARFISQGYLPYRDFMLVHPPLYDLLLASIYRVFGYSFFSGRYLSVALSIGGIVLIYLVGKRLHHPTAGFAAAGLFAVSPDMIYLGRRAVQEPLGILLLLVALYCAIDFVSNGRRNRALICGLALGLAVATKYLFIPAAVAIVLAVILATMGERYWRSFKTLGKPRLWGWYFSLALLFWSLLLLLRWSLKLDISIPLLDPMYPAAKDVIVTVVVFLLPLLISLVILEKHFPLKDWWLRVWELRSNQGLWLLVAGIILGFMLVAGFFLAKAPGEFWRQTVWLQQNRPGVEFPSFVGLIRLFPVLSTFEKAIWLPFILVIPLIFILLNKRGFSRSDFFLAATLVMSLVLCQGFKQLPRYYYGSVYPLLLLGIAQLMPALDTNILGAELKSIPARSKGGLLAVSLAFLLFVGVTVVLLATYTHYDVFKKRAFYEERVYKETIHYLQEVGAKKVYAAFDPLFVALSPNLDSTLAFDTFALFWLEGKPPEMIVKEAMQAGVDYVVIDPFVELYQRPDAPAVQLLKEVRRNGKLARVIPSDSRLGVAIYLLADKNSLAKD